MKRFLATTAIAALMAAPMAAQAETQAQQTQAQQMKAPEMSVGEQSMSADTLIGKRIYMPGKGDDSASMTDVTEAPDNWDDVGEIGDVQISKDGKVNSVIADIGGFLGMGEHEVSLTMDNLRFVPDADDKDDYFVLYEGDRSMLEKADEFSRDTASNDGVYLSDTENGDHAARVEGASNADAVDGSTDTVAAKGGSGSGSSDAKAGSSEMAKSDSDTSMKSTEEQSTMAQTASDDAAAQDLLDDMQRAALTADDLEGKAVIGSDGDRVGEISDLVLTNDGKIEKVIVDVGGFLGIGEKPVAMSFDELRISKDENGGLSVRTDQTESSLKNMEKWKG
jgi:sporulation protein YlmC with PRC-barrel domain